MTDARATMLFSSKYRVENDPMGEDRNTWETIIAAALHAHPRN